MLQFGKRGRQWLRAALGLLATTAAISPVASAPTLEWHAEQGFRWSPLPVAASGRTGFTLLPAASTSVVFTNTLDEYSGATNRVLFNGAGLAAGDFDHDGLPDIFFCNLNGSNVLFRNLGQWRFEDVTAAAGLATPHPLSRGAVFADLDGDSWLDLLISVTGGGVLCYRNDGHGRFVDATATAGTSSKFGSLTLALADVDGNGTLDLYIGNNRPDDIRDRGRAAVTMVDGRPVMRGTEANRFVMLHNRLEECGQADQLLLNDGTGRFREVSWTGGAFVDDAGRPLTEPPADWALTATFRDVNADQAPDIYVCNDYWTPDRFWINDGHGRFRAVDNRALRKTSASSMSVDFADIDRDGFVDFLVVDMLSRYPHLRKRQLFAQIPMATPLGVIEDRPQTMRSTLFLNRQDGTFAEIAYYANLQGCDWSWAPLFLDVDLDGYEDLLIGAGYFRDVQDYDAENEVRARQHSWTGFRSEAERQRAFTLELMEHYRLYPPLLLPIGGFRNLRNCRFEEVTEAWGLNVLGCHQGIAMADFDRDGDVDLAVNNLNGPASLFRNESPASRVAVRLKGRPPNTQGIGSKIVLLGGAVPRQSTELICGGHYLSASEPQAVFAAGTTVDGMTLEVRWRNGTRSVVSGVQANRVYEIDETASQPAAVEIPQPPTPVFEDVSSLLAHQHQETEFNDYERQPLLPFKLSQMGPGVAWTDLDGDGHDDLVVGAGRGGSPAWFRSNGRGQFTAAPANPALTVPDDLAGLVGWEDGTGRRGVLAGLTGYEVNGSFGALSFAATNNALAPGTPVASEMTGGGALALGDMNGDGRLALFVSGGVAPGQYPLSAPSKLYRFDGGGWRLDARNSLLLQNLGIVHSALWSDLDGDGRPELVLACEWGPIRVFKNRGGSLFEVTEQFGLKSLTGWWRGVTAGDLNNDGRLDLIAANWGLNSQYRASPEKPLALVYGQMAQPGVMDIVETEYVNNILAPARQFREMAASLPFLQERFSTHKAYSEATLDEVLGDRKVLAKRVTAVTLTSMAFLNTGQGFQPVELPRDAQFSPAFSVNVADLDGDGNDDVFLSQNMFDLQPQISRIDAGVGLWLRGDGTGQLTPVPTARSGVYVFGQQRGAAVGDYDEDGRADLVVTQNGASTRLFHNVGAAPGLRVKLKGPPGNPNGIGAVVRLQFKDRQGPAREIHAGSGYWSQDSLIPVLGTPTPPESLWIRWPGGRVTTTSIPPNTRQVTVDTEGRTTDP